MLFADKESNLLDVFRRLSTDEILLIPDDTQTRQVCECILDNEQWEKWTDSSAKDAPPPDYYNDDKKLMMEVMRVDDHSFTKNGKVINPMLMKEREMEHELIEAGVFDVFPNIEKVYINAVTGLPSKEDHNFGFYFDNFLRIVEHHKGKIPNYKRTHPDHKILFFVFDESSAYVEALSNNQQIETRGMVTGHPHLYFRDKRFINVFRNTGIDFLIWFTPYKMYLPEEHVLDFPKAVVFDCNNISIKLENYETNKMISSEP